MKDLAERRAERSEPRPRHVVALGGGTGLPAVLRGLRELVARGEPTSLTAVVAMSDDGGSSGRLRRSRGVPPPGDVRNCLVALSAEEDLLAGLFQHRYDGEEELGGHNLGNLILAALAEQTGSFLKAVEVSSRVLRTVGRILPVTLEDVTLEATLADGTRLRGETEIGVCQGQVKRVTLRPMTARPTPGVVDAIRDADLVVIGPGSLYTSVVPTLVLEPVAEALAETNALRVLVGNLVSDAGEAAELEIGDHLRALQQHVGAEIVDAVLAHEGPIDDEIVQRYRAEGARPLRLTEERIGRARVFCRNLLAAGPLLRHEPLATAEGLMDVWSRMYGSLPCGEERVSSPEPGMDRDKRPDEIESGPSEPRAPSASRTRRAEHSGIVDEILTSREACELLKIGRTKLWELTRRNFLPAYRLGEGNRAELRYKRSELLAWLEQNRV